MNNSIFDVKFWQIVSRKSFLNFSETNKLLSANTNKMLNWDEYIDEMALRATFYDSERFWWAGVNDKKIVFNVFE